MSRGTLLALATTCLVLGLVDLVALNVWLVPAALSEVAPTEIALGPTSQSSEPRTPGDTFPATKPTAPPTAASSAVMSSTAQPPSTTVPSAEPTLEPTRTTVVPATATPSEAPETTATPEPTKTAPPATEPAPTPATPATAPPSEQLLFRAVTLLFGRGQCLLSEGAKQTLDKYVEELKSHPDVHVRVEGHTDKSGDPDSHGSLSALRAQKTAEYMIEQGIDPSRITHRGLGAGALVDSSDTAYGRARNRRAVVRIVRGQP